MARLAFTPVNVSGKIVAGRIVGCAGSVLQHFDDCPVQGRKPSFTKTANRFSRIDLRTEERLRRVDISYAGEVPLIEQKQFYRLLRSSRETLECLLSKGGVQRFEANFT